MSRTVSMFCLPLLAALVLFSGVASAQEPPKGELVVYPLRHTQADFTGQLVVEVFDGRPLRVATDPRTNSLIVSGPKELHDEVRALLENLDQAAATPDLAQDELPPMQVRVFWLASGLKEGSIPEALEPVVQEMTELGIHELRMAGQMSINVGTVSKSQFTVSGTPELGGQEYLLELKGSLWRKEGGEIMMQSTIDCRRGWAEKTPIANIQTTIETPLNQFIVLGTTTAGTSNSVFVLQLVPRAEAKKQ
jgi:uncharacterized protein YjeT (DUF2065 family)